MARIRAHRCLLFVKRPSDEGGDIHLEDIALPLVLSRSSFHRLRTAVAELDGLGQDALTSAERFRMLLTILAQRLYTATGILDICQTVFDEMAKQDRRLHQPG